MPGDPADSNVVEVIGAGASGAALILCEHASNAIPARYDGLGLDAQAARSHAAWDPGARDLALHLREGLDGTLVACKVSRLVYDCNRAPDAPSAMPAKSEVIDVPGNAGLGPDGRSERIEAVYRPFCAAVTAQIETRLATAQPTALITVHSFTPVYYGEQRRTEIGILHDRDTTLADAMLKAAERYPARTTARNRPYGPEDGVTHSLKIHALPHKIPNVMIEVRNDLLRTQEDIARIGDELIEMITSALAELGLQERGSTDA